MASSQKELKSPLRVGRSPSTASQRPMVLWNVGRDMEVLSDDSDGGDQRNLRRERSRKPKYYLNPPIRRPLMKAKDLFSARSARTASTCTSTIFNLTQSSQKEHQATSVMIQSPTSSSNQSIASSSSGQVADVVTVNQMHEAESLPSPPPPTPARAVDPVVIPKSASSKSLPQTTPPASDTVVIEANFDDSKSWVVYSLWNPAFHYLYEFGSTSQLLPGELRDFKNLIIEDVERAFNFPSEYKERNIHLMRVQEVVRSDVDGSKMEIHGSWCTFGAPQDSTQLGGGTKGVLLINPPQLCHLLHRTVKPNDIIVNFSLEVSAATLDADSCVVHLALKEYHPDVEALFSDICNLVRIDISRVNSPDPCESYTVCKFSSTLVKWPEKKAAPKQVKTFQLSRQNVQSEVLSSRKRRRLQHESPADVEVIELDDEPEPATTIKEAEPNLKQQQKNSKKSPSRKKVKDATASLSNIQGDVSAPLQGQGSNAPVEDGRSTQSKSAIIIDLTESDSDEFEDAEDVVLLNSDVKPSTSTSQEPQDVNPNQTQFDLKEFLRSGQFVPGPLRPKLKKTSSSEGYVYHKLIELEGKIHHVTEVAHQKKKMPCPMVPNACNIHAVVVKIITDHRHPRAYLVRISDETKRSVLLRLHHMSEGNMGPEIQIGDVIRVHRVTAQSEWDSEVSDNVMVLSTCSHRNYVIFRFCPESRDKFYFESCAKSITLDDDIDRPRVAKLHQLNLSVSDQLVAPDEIMENEQLGGTAYQDLQLPLGDIFDGDFMDAESDGICDSDIISPPCSVFDEVRILDVEGIPSPTRRHSPGGNSSLANSEDSYVTAPCGNANVQENRPITPPQVINSLRELGKTDLALTMILKLNSYVWASGGGCHLVVKDFESSIPPQEFKRAAPPDVRVQVQEDELVMDIANIEQFLERGLSTKLDEWMESDSVYVVERVRVKGDTPPYVLELDGECSEIRETTMEDLNFLELEMTFTCTTTDAEVRRHSEILNGEETSNANGAYLPEEAFAPDPSPESADRSHADEVEDSQLCMPPPSLETIPWTGRRKGRRKPRIFYA